VVRAAGSNIQATSIYQLVVHSCRCLSMHTSYVLQVVHTRSSSYMYTCQHTGYNILAAVHTHGTAYSYTGVSIFLR